jgi:hypothetical protein
MEFHMFDFQSSPRVFNVMVSIIEAGLLEDRLEYNSDDLASMYDLEDDEAEVLYEELRNVP